MLWHILLVVVDLAAGFGGLVWVYIRSEGAVVWGRAHEERCSRGMDRVVVGGRSLLWRRDGIYRVMPLRLTWRMVALGGLTMVSCFWRRRGRIAPRGKSAWRGEAAMEPFAWSVKS